VVVGELTIKKAECCEGELSQKKTKNGRHTLAQHCGAFFWTEVERVYGMQVRSDR
jgi:hypothetical protein